MLEDALSHVAGQKQRVGCIRRQRREEASAGKIPRGMMTERANMRGVTRRGALDGGNQERDLAVGLRKDAGAIERWPNTAAMLSAMADRWDAYAEHEDVDARQRRLRS